MPHWLYRIQPIRDDMLTSGPDEREQALVTEHFAYLQKLHEQGVVKLAGRTLTTDSASFGIVLFQAESEEAAHRIMRGDPAVKGRVFRGELFPFRVAICND